MFVRDNFTCNKCKFVFGPKELIGDHIVPIALGGLQWEMENIQTLCVGCDKMKTRDDHKLIAKARRAEKTVFGKKYTKLSIKQLYDDAIRDGDLV